MKSRQRKILLSGTVARFIIFILCVLSLSCNDKITDLDISGEWELYVSDIENFDNINFYHEKRKCNIPGDWARVLQKNPDNMSFIWLVKEITIPETLNNQSLVLFLGRIALSDRTFFNGKEIGGTGYIPAKENPLDYGFALKNNRKYYIPSSIIKYGEKNIIAVQVFSHIFSGFPDIPFITTQQSLEYRHYLAYYVPVLQNTGAVIINIILFIMIAYALKKRYMYPFLLYLLMFLLATTFAQHLIMGGPCFGNGLLRYKLIIIFFIISVFVAYLIMLDSVIKRIPAVLKMLSAYFVFAIAVVSYTPHTAFFIRVSVPCCIGFMVLCSLFVFVPLLYRLYLYPLRYYYKLISIFPFIVIVWITFYNIFTLNIYRMQELGFVCVPLFFINTLWYVIEFNKNSIQRTDAVPESANGIAKKKSRAKQLEIINSIIRHLENNFSENYNRQELAQKFNIHDNYMVQLFKKHTGRSISDYINMLRIRASIDLIEKDDSKIIDIAYHVGFNNLTYFYRAFKLRMGMTPNKYRSIKLKQKTPVEIQPEPLPAEDEL